MSLWHVLSSHKGLFSFLSSASLAYLSISVLLPYCLNYKLLTVIIKLRSVDQALFQLILPVSRITPPYKFQHKFSNFILKALGILNKATWIFKSMWETKLCYSASLSINMIYLWLFIFIQWSLTVSVKVVFLFNLYLYVFLWNYKCCLQKFFFWLI